MIKCSICKKIAKNVSPPELVEKFNWIGMGKNRNNKEVLFWYCPKHSVKAIFNYGGAI